MGGMAGEMDEGLDQRMDGWTGHQGEKKALVQLILEITNSASKG